MNRNVKIVVVCPSGPGDTDITSPRLWIPFAMTMVVYNGDATAKPEPYDLYFSNPLGITEANRRGLLEAITLQPDIIVLCDKGDYRYQIQEIVDYHLAHGLPVTITTRRNPKWEKWTGRIGSRIVHHAARILLGLPFEDNCAGLYVFNNLSRLKPMFEELKSKHHFFDTELRYRLLEYYDENEIAQYCADNIVTGGDTLKWHEIKDTAINFYRMWRNQ